VMCGVESSFAGANTIKNATLEAWEDEFLS
jgi:hypothetical protein